MTSRIQFHDPREDESFSRALHYEMLSDTRRLEPFKRAIERTCAGKRVLESGAGSGILSLLAARAGATHVYAVEVDADTAQIARENIARNRLEHVITLLVKDTRDVTLTEIGGERADVVIAENLSTWQVSEPQISVLNHVNRELLKAEGVRLPERIFNTLELANSQYTFEGLVQLRAHYLEFTGVRRAIVLSRPFLFATVDLRQENGIEVNQSVSVPVTEGGIVNSLRLTSPLQHHDDIRFDSSDSLMPPVVIPLEEDLAVVAGDIVEVSVQYKHESKWERFHCAGHRRGSV
jgi:predicted RNA methylase